MQTGRRPPHDSHTKGWATQIHTAGLGTGNTDTPTRAAQYTWAAYTDSGLPQTCCHSQLRNNARSHSLALCGRIDESGSRTSAHSSACSPSLTCALLLIPAAPQLTALEVSCMCTCGVGHGVFTRPRRY